MKEKNIYLFSLMIKVDLSKRFFVRKYVEMIDFLLVILFIIKKFECAINVPSPLPPSSLRSLSLDFLVKTVQNALILKIVFIIVVKALRVSGFLKQRFFKNN